VSGADGRDYRAWTLALAHSAAEQHSLEKEVNLLQECLNCILKLEKNNAFKSKDPGTLEFQKEFRRALSNLAVYRTKERQKQSEAKSKLEQTRHELRLQGYELDKDDD